VRTFVDQVLALHRALDAAGVGHGFGGAVALAFAVLEPRNTDDIDVNICVPVEEAAAVLACLPAEVDRSEADVAAVRSQGQVRLRWHDERTPVDLFFPQHAFHDEVAAEITTVPFAGTGIPIISATHLTVFKALFDRAKDWPDIQAMLQAGTVDVPRALAWVQTLLGADAPQLARLRELAVAAGRPGARRPTGRGPTDGIPGPDEPGAHEPGADEPGAEMARPPVRWPTG